MFGEERRNKIMALLQEKRSLLVQEVAVLFAVTEETIRRDLKVLEKQECVIRTHGGAMLSDDLKAEAPLVIRQGINIAAKNAIGQRAAAFVNDGDTIFLDASTSSLFVAKYLKDKKGLTVITNAVKILLELAESPELTLIATGGVTRPKSLSFVGRAAETAIGSYHADTAFFSCKGFSPKRGLTDSNEQESVIRRLMIQCSQKAIFLCDDSKWDKVGYVTTAQLAELDVMVSNQALPPGWAEEIAGQGVELIVTE